MWKIFKCIALFFSGLFNKEPMKRMEVDLKPISSHYNQYPMPHPHIPYRRFRHDKFNPNPVIPEMKTEVEKDKQSESINWSGYVATQPSSKNKFTSVSASWVVPDVSKSIGNSYCAIWIGMDGYSAKNDTVEQIGTSSDFLEGKQYNYAWFEMFPNNAHEIKNFPIKVGDLIAANLDYLPTNSCFKMKLTNASQKTYIEMFVHDTTLKKPKGSSAEWIVEAPLMNGNVLPLSNFGMLFMTSCKCSLNGINGAIINPVWESFKINMIQSNGNIKSFTSGLSLNNENFFVEWKHS